MQFSSLLLSCLLASVATVSVQGHTYLSSVNGNLGAVRQLTKEKQYPVMSVTSPDITCGANVGPATSSITVEAGASVKVQYYHNTESPNDDIMDRSHAGPCYYYMTQLTDNVQAAKWFKIQQANAIGEKWCTHEIIDQRGVINVKIPAELAAGQYLLRSELIALHEADPARGLAQYYIHCAQVTVTRPAGSGAGSLPSAQYLTSIPGHMTAAENVYDMYNNGPKQYPLRGPAIAKFDAATAPAASPAAPASPPTVPAASPAAPATPPVPAVPAASSLPKTSPKATKKPVATAEDSSASSMLSSIAHLFLGATAVAIAYYM